MTMKSVILATFALASFTAAFRGAVEFCKDSPLVNITGCATYLFYDEDCWDLPEGDDSAGHLDLRNNTHYVAPSDILRCNVFNETGCDGLLSQVTVGSNHHFDVAVSSIECTGHGTG